MDSAIARALRVSVPLNTRCSRKCDAPEIGPGSSRPPTPTQNPTVADLASGIRSVTRRMPLARTDASISGSIAGKSAAAAAATAAPAAATTAAPAASTIAATAAARRRLLPGGAEVAELLAQLGVERVLEGHVLAVTGRGAAVAGAGARVAAGALAGCTLGAIAAA